MVVCLFRHAKSEANEKHLFGTDLPLSRAGIEQAEDDAKHLGFRPQVALSGYLQRQKQTASILFPDVYDDANVFSIFDEIHFGNLEGKHISKEFYPVVRDDPTILKTLYHGDDIWGRADHAIGFLRELEVKYPGTKSIAIVTSGTLMQAIVTRIVHGKKNGIIWSGKYYFPNCSYITLSISGGNLGSTTKVDKSSVSDIIKNIQVGERKDI